MFNLFFKGKSESELSKIKIINFNYDRSFDYALNFFLKSESVEPFNFGEFERTYRTSISGHLDLKAPAIFHPYGSLGTLSEISYGQKFQLNSDFLNRIKVISKEREGFDEIRKIVAESRTIVFLGFGFDKTNIENLGLTYLSRQEARDSYAKIWFSSFNMDNFFITSTIKHIIHPYQIEDMPSLADELCSNQVKKIIKSIHDSKNLSAILTV